MTNIIRCFKGKKAEGELAMCLGVLVFVMMAIIAINMANVIILRVEIDRRFDDLMEVCSVEGTYDGTSYTTEKSQFIAFFTNLQQGNVNVKRVEFNESAPEGYFNESKHEIQLGDEMQVTLHVRFTLKNLGQEIVHDVYITRTRLSGYYWKT